MAWILRCPNIHSAFSSLGFLHGDVYHISDSCNATLESILNNILTEDKYLRNYRRTISFAQYVRKDLRPLLLNTKEDKTIGLLIKILTNLTIPVECLLSMETVTKSDLGRHTVFELKNLLSECKNLFVDAQATKVVIDFLKKNVKSNVQALCNDQCDNVLSCLNLVRNVVHIVEETSQKQKHSATQTSTVQNQIVWNMFSQGFDKVIIRLMTVPEASNWSEIIVQIVALLYKDRHVGMIQKLLNAWLEASMSESSEDNESNTSPQNRRSASDSPMLTTDQTNSDSSDNCTKGKAHGGTTNEHEHKEKPNEHISRDATAPTSDNSLGSSDDENANVNFNDYLNTTGNIGQVKGYITMNKPQDNVIERKTIESNQNDDRETSYHKIPISHDLRQSNKYKNPSPCIKRSIEYRDKDLRHIVNDSQSCSPPPTKMLKTQTKTTTSENSDCGYFTQIENREPNSSSSNDDDIGRKPVHVKPHHLKQKANTKAHINNNKPDDKRRKKLVKRGKSKILNVKGLQYHQPTDEDIVLVMKEFTVDFMLKGYSSLVKTLHKQILNYDEAEIERSHFFWLVSYFLKFAIQMELDLEHVESVLSFDVMSFLIAEGASLCEQFDLAIKFNGPELNSCRRKLHLVVTAIREFVQSVDTFQKSMCSSYDDMSDPLIVLQHQMWETEELRYLMVLLVRSYDGDHHDKQYLQDLVVTNHLLLLFLDKAVKMPGHTSKLSMIDHIKQFATPHMMRQYGILLEDYQTNGEFVNDCVFTIMHHVAGTYKNLELLFQPCIMRTFTSIRKSEYEICDQWSDLVEYVLNSWTRHPLSFSEPHLLPWAALMADGLGVFAKPLPPKIKVTQLCSELDSTTTSRWTEGEKACLNWNFMQSKESDDVIGDIVNLYRVDCIVKERHCVVEELFSQGVIGKKQFESFMVVEKSSESSKSTNGNEKDIRSLCERLSQRGHTGMLDWVKEVLLEVCYVKIRLGKQAAGKIKQGISTTAAGGNNFMTTKLEYTMSPVAYHNILVQKAVPVVPWTCEHAAICRDSDFLLFLDKMNLEMPLNTGKLFIRIPHSWTAEILYRKATIISTVDESALKFSVSDISEDKSVPLDSTATSSPLMVIAAPALAKIPLLPIPDSCYRVQRFKQVGAMLQYTPTPGLSDDIDDAASNLPFSHNTETSEWLKLVKRSKENEFVSEPPGSFQSSKPVFEQRRWGATTSCQQSEENITRKPNPDGLSSNGKDERNNDSYNVCVSEEESACDTESVASDFCRMYVSDEEDNTDDVLNPSDRLTFSLDDLPIVETSTCSVNISSSYVLECHSAPAHIANAAIAFPITEIELDHIAEVRKLTAGFREIKSLSDSIQRNDMLTIDKLRDNNNEVQNNKAVRINGKMPNAEIAQLNEETIKDDLQLLEKDIEMIEYLESHAE